MTCRPSTCIWPPAAGAAKTLEDEARTVTTVRAAYAPMTAADTTEAIARMRPRLRRGTGRVVRRRPSGPDTNAHPCRVTALDDAGCRGLGGTHVGMGVNAPDGREVGPCGRGPAGRHAADRQSDAGCRGARGRHDTVRGGCGGDRADLRRSSNPGAPRLRHDPCAGSRVPSWTT